MAQSHESSDWEYLKHWKYCVGGNYQEMRRKTKAGVADEAFKGLNLTASVISLLPIPGARIVSTVVVLANYAIQWLGGYDNRERAFKILRRQFEMMFGRQLFIPFTNLNRHDRCIAVRNIPVGAIELIVDAYRKHTFEKLGVPTRIRDDMGGRIVPARMPGDLNERHLVQCVDCLKVYDVQNLDRQIEWLFAFNPHDQVADDIITRYENRGWRETEPERPDPILGDPERPPAWENGGVDDDDYPPDVTPNGNGYENGEGSNLLIPLVIFIAAFLYFRDRK